MGCHSFQGNLVRRVFIDKKTISGDTATIIGPEAHHLGVVLRLRPGEKIELFDGTGRVYQARIKNIKKSVIETTIIATADAGNKPPFLHLGLGLLKSKKMAFVIQKANELGVSSIFPLSSQNCAVPPPAAAQQKRWQRIILESCKQCGRPKPLVCHPHLHFADFVEHCGQFASKTVLWEKEKGRSLRHLAELSQPRAVLLLIGPEGGFQDTEIALAAKYNFTTATLGARVLRAETAVISAISISQFLLGNLDYTD